MCSSIDYERGSYDIYVGLHIKKCNFICVNEIAEKALKFTDSINFNAFNKR